MMKRGGLELTRSTVHRWKMQLIHQTPQQDEPVARSVQDVNFGSVDLRLPPFNFQPSGFQIPTQQAPPWEQQEKPKWTVDPVLAELYGIPMYQEYMESCQSELCWGNINQDIPPVPNA